MATTLNTLSLAPTATGKGESYRMLFQSPAAYEEDDPDRPPKGVSVDDLLLQDVSLSALMSELAGYGKSASIQLEDGYSFLSGPMMKREVISKLPQAWSGPPSLKIGRHHGTKEAIEPCVSIGLRIQPELFYRFLKRDKCESRHLGLWPRFLTFCFDPSRFPVTPWYSSANPMASYLPLMERLAALLLDADTLKKTDEPARKVLVMDTYANARLREITHWIKGQMHGEFHDIQDAAGRAAENTLRLASNFHVVCQGEGPISSEMIERAWAFVAWSLTQFRNVFVHALQPPPKPLRVKPIKPPTPPLHQQQLNADMRFMLECIAARIHQHPHGKVPQAEVALLTGFTVARFCRTLGWLVTARFIYIEGDDKNATIHLLAPRYVSAPYGYVPSALGNCLL